jgi:hypothetical protein
MKTSFFRLPMAFPLAMASFAGVAACGSERPEPVLGDGDGTTEATVDDSVYAFLSRPLTTDEVAAAWAGLPYERISMDRSVCFGTCPSYAVELRRGEGSETLAPAAYTGRDYVDRMGPHEGQIDLWAYARLCQLLDHLGFRDLRPSYAAPWTDDFTVVIEVDRLGERYEVSDYGQQAPPDFMALRLAIDANVAEIDWREQ